MTESDNAVSVISVGARTPIGLCAPLAAAAVRAGICRIAEHPTAVDQTSEFCMVAMDRTLPATTRVDRLKTLLTSALDEALAGVKISPRARIPVLLALPESGPFFSDKDAAHVADYITTHLGSRFDVAVEPIAEGNAAGLLGLKQANDLLRTGRQPFAVVAGVDSQVDEAFLTKLDEAGRLMSAFNTWGYPPGEGAGAVVLASAKGVSETGAKPLVDLRSIGVAREQNLIATEAICIGAGLTEAFQQALAKLSPPEEISWVYCDLNPERYRMNEYLYSAMRVSEFLPRAADRTAPVDCWGDMGAATVPLLISLVVASSQRGYSPGPLQLIWASSESGLRGAAVLDVAQNVPIKKPVKAAKPVKSIKAKKAGK